MKATDTIKNAQITGTMLGVEDHGILTFMLYLDYGGSGQGFGGYALDCYDKERKVRVGEASGIDLIRGILDTLEVRSWEELKGTHCRVVADHMRVYRIGHFLKDRWFNPEEVLK